MTNTDATPLSDPQRTASSGFTRRRIVALIAIAFLAAGLAYLGLSGASSMSVPNGAQEGDLVLEPCTYGTEAGDLPADCGTLVVPENRRDPDSRLIALPVTRIRATGSDPAEPVFRLEGGPGLTNMTFATASRLTERHDVVLVGYRGVEGSEVLECPEVVSALKRSVDFGGAESQQRFSEAIADCHERLRDAGIDLDGYSLPQRVDDLEAARTALGYERINLVSESVGTRTAMIYSWRHPDAIARSVMIAPNPPGHFMWYPDITDDLLARYAEACEQDSDCSSRTANLADSMRAVGDDFPDRWLFLPIEEGNVRTASMWGLFETSDVAAPLHAPATIDAWVSAADGDAAGFWFQSLLADLAFPEAFVWGEYAATGVADAGVVEAYYAAGGDPGSILGNVATDFSWGGGELASAWPASPDYAEYQDIATSQIDTLLISGELDFSTPAIVATEKLLPQLPNGEQVILPNFGHSSDFWEYQPEASERLLTTFLDTGQVDDSLYVDQRVDFDVGVATHSFLAWIVLGIFGVFVVAAVLLLSLMALRVRRQGAIGSTASAWLRTLSPPVVGLGGWFLTLLALMTVWPAMPFDNALVAVLSMGAPIGLGIYLAWVDRDWSPERRRGGLAASVVGALAGAWFGFVVVDGLVAVATTLVGSAVAANLALIVIDISSDRAAGRPVAGPVDPGRRPSRSSLDELTEHEAEALVLLARGMNDDEIATQMNTDEVTAKAHMIQLFTKLGVRDSVQAVVLAYEAGLVEPGTDQRLGVDRSDPILGAPQAGTEPATRG